MTSMEILPEGGRTLGRNAKKRVRFSVQESELDTDRKRKTIAEYRRREAGEFLTAKRRFPKMCTCKISELREERVKESVKGNLKEFDRTEAQTRDTKDTATKYAKRRKREAGNINCNCATKGKNSSTRNEIVRVNHTKRKCKSDECLSKHRDRKRKKVISKKTSVKDDSWCARYRYVIGDKRKVSDILREFRALSVKKRKLSQAGSNMKKRYSVQNRGKPSVGPKSKLKVKAYRAKMASASVKRANERLKRAKAAKRKSLMKKANEKRKKAMKRKEKLKRKLAQKRKASKKKNSICKRKIARSRRPRKIKIIPIEREEEVSENLRVNLLKFLTFERAYEKKYECCKRYCWDKWEELDIDDVIADFD